MQIELPHNENAEYQILSAIINSHDCLNESLGCVNETHFHDKRNKLIYNVVMQIIKEDNEVSVHAILMRLERDNILNISGGNDYIHNLMAMAPDIYDFQDAFPILDDVARKRNIILLGESMIRGAANCQGSPQTIIEDYQKKLCNITSSQSSKSPQEATGSSLIDDIGEGMSLIDKIKQDRHNALKGIRTQNGVETGFPQIDQLIGGFNHGTLTYIGARTGMGKTTFCLNICLNQIFADKPKKILFFTLEMTKEKILTILVAMKANVPYKKILRGKINDQEEHNLNYACMQFKNKPIIFQGQDNITISKLRAIARRHHAAGNVDIIYVDYLTMVKSDEKNASKHLDVDEISKGLQTLSRELNIPIVAIAQLNRALEARVDKRPQLSDFRECGSIEEDADNVLFLYRPAYYNPEDKPGLLECRIAKNRELHDLDTIELALEGQTLKEINHKNNWM